MIFEVIPGVDPEDWEPYCAMLYIKFHSLLILFF